MADSRVRADLSAFVNELQGKITKATTATEMRAVGDQAAEIIRRRARLGYGSAGSGGDRFNLPPLSDRYVRFRQTSGAKYLSKATTAKKSNLTFTGQMLDSLAVVKVEQGSVVVAPTGTRTDRFSRGKTNAQIAAYVSAKGRPFISLTPPEVSQLVRFYRTRFGDLVR